MPPPPKLTTVDHTDIRPPIQPLALLPDSEAYYQEKQVMVRLAPKSDGLAVWQQLQQLLLQQGIKLTPE